MTIDQPIAVGIDLGSNTFRLLVAAQTADKLEVLEKKLVTVRLGHALSETQKLQERAMDSGLEALRSFRNSIESFRPQRIRVCGTEALRQAQNSDLFLQKAEEILRHNIDIISGEEEARLSLMGVLSGCDEPLSGNMLLVDVGGGSTEFIHTDSSTEKISTTSTPMGVVSLTEKYLGSLKPDLGLLDKFLFETINNCLEELDISEMSASMSIVGSGGTATSLAALDLNLKTYSETLVHGHFLTSETMEKLWDRLIVIPPKKRNEINCLGDGRGEILPAGLRIYQVLLKALGHKKLRVSDSGLLEGILLSSLADKAP
jgi:exopolyphosphatase/guanosine-5'-triphosphate,3'-diphosphate pyrophosphatase